MPTLTPQEESIFFQARGRLGFSTFYGTIFLGFTQLGDPNPYAGIYRHTKYYDYYSWQRILMNWPTNPQTEAQQAWRSVFSDAVSAWQALSAPDKALWHDIGVPKRLPGYNAFISDYLKNH